MVYLYHALNKIIPGYLIKITRSQSKQPLHITAIGIPLENAAANIKLMAGKYRIPDLLSFLDQQTKLFKAEKARQK